MPDDNRFNSYRRIEYDPNGNPYDPDVFNHRRDEPGSLLVTFLAFIVILLLVFFLAGCTPNSDGHNILHNPLPPEPIPVNTEAPAN